MNKLRMRFSKTGRAIYISHLDLMATMQRAFSRAGSRLQYSEGFNPRPQISIALPLSVGTASLCELMDFRLLEEVNITSLAARLNATMPEGITVQEIYEPTRKNAELKWLAVEGLFEYDDRTVDIMQEQLADFFARPSIVIEKKTKRGFGEVDIRPAIREIAFAAGEDGVHVSAVLSAQSPTLNPDLLPAALRALAPEIAPDFAKFTRIETYDAEMKLFR
jgi:radical SAM-linked protein